jgi:hypothetical protein
MTDNSLIKEQFYNADETGLFYKGLPNKTLGVPTQQGSKWINTAARYCCV